MRTKAEEALRDWARDSGYVVDQFVLSVYGPDKGCDLCGEPLACGYVQEGVGEFSRGGETVLAHAHCGFEHELEVA